MVGVQKAVALLVFVVVVEGLRHEIDPSDDPGSNEALRKEAALMYPSTSGDALPDALPMAIVAKPECHLSRSECNIGDMHEPTLVFTDKPNSQCMNGDPASFVVHPGRTDKLLFYFSGGGACWESPWFGAEACVQSVRDGLPRYGLGAGAQETGRKGNMFGDFTLVSPPYCDGGAFISNTTLNGKPQNGYHNTLFAVEWAKRNLDETLANFVFAGSSGGALGTVGWAHSLLSTFQYIKATVIIDSYMGLFPDGTQGPTVEKFGACNLPILADFREVCNAEQANIPDVFDHAMSMHPTVAFAIIQSKWDIVQRLFFSAIAASFGDPDVYMGAARFYEETNLHMQRYDSHHNFVHYYVDGPYHIFLDSSLFYHSATVTGFTGLLGDGGKPTLENWTNALIEHEPVQSLCHGDLERNGATREGKKNTQYCYDKLYPKTLNLTALSSDTVTVSLPPLPPGTCSWYCFTPLLCPFSACGNNCGFCH